MCIRDSFHLSSLELRISWVLLNRSLPNFTRYNYKYTHRIYQNFNWIDPYFPIEVDATRYSTYICHAPLMKVTQSWNQTLWIGNFMNLSTLLTSSWNFQFVWLYRVINVAKEGITVDIFNRTETKTRVPWKEWNTIENRKSQNTVHSTVVMWITIFENISKIT